MSQTTAPMRNESLPVKGWPSAGQRQRSIGPLPAKVVVSNSDSGEGAAPRMLAREKIEGCCALLPRKLAQLVGVAALGVAACVAASGELSACSFGWVVENQCEDHRAQPGMHGQVVGNWGAEQWDLPVSALSSGIGIVSEVAFISISHAEENFVYGPTPTAALGCGITFANGLLLQTDSPEVKWGSILHDMEKYSNTQNPKTKELSQTLSMGKGFAKIENDKSQFMESLNKLLLPAHTKAAYLGSGNEGFVLRLSPEGGRIGHDEVVKIYRQPIRGVERIILDAAIPNVIHANKMGDAAAGDLKSFPPSKNPFITMDHAGDPLIEFGKKVTLPAWVAGCSVSVRWQVVKKIIKEMCIGVQELHERGFVHCDLKPENVCVALPSGCTCPQAPTDVAGLKITLIDVGLADSLEGGRVESHKRFLFEQNGGTDGYKPPVCWPRPEGCGWCGRYRGTWKNGKPANDGFVDPSQGQGQQEYSRSMKACDKYAVGVIGIELIAHFLQIAGDGWKGCEMTKGFGKDTEHYDEKINNMTDGYGKILGLWEYGEDPPPKQPRAAYEALVDVFLSRADSTGWIREAQQFLKRDDIASEVAALKRHLKGLIFSATEMATEDGAQVPCWASLGEMETAFKELKKTVGIKIED
eukprot:gene92-302_t